MPYFKANDKKAFSQIKIVVVRFLQMERFEQLCQNELSFSFAKVNSDIQQHFSRLFSFSRAIKYMFSFLILKGPSQPVCIAAVCYCYYPGD